MRGLALWWRDRSARERMLLGIMAALIAVVLLWIAVVRPLADALDAAKTRHGLAVVALAEAKARARPTRARPSPLTGPIHAMVSQSAAEAGFTGARIAVAGGSRVGVAIDAARPPALFGWIARMEASGVRVERLRAQANPDRTVSGEIVFSAGVR
jgi:general secretion pathway protein M